MKTSLLIMKQLLKNAYWLRTQIWIETNSIVIRANFIDIRNFINYD